MRPCFRIALLIALCALPLDADYAPPVIEQVPVARLVANLEVLARENPRDAGVQINLARAHGMAYAEKTETIAAGAYRGSKGPQTPWFGHEHPNVPFKAKPTSDPAKQAAAAVHLKAAARHFQNAIEIDRNHLIARLGLAWCLEHSGDKLAAIAGYREVIARAWKSEGRLTQAGLGFAPVTAEAADYLIPLLDKDKDAAEIATLRERRARLLRLPRPITPVAVPLRDGLALTDIVDDEAAVRFDADGLGKKAWTWITPDAGWLVYDQVGRAEINSALQLFGSVSFWMFWETGYDAMRALDDNHDGRLAGAELRHLRLWRDANSNGVSDRGEVRTLASYRIVSLSYDYARMADDDHTPFVARGVTFRDGTTRPTWDVVLQPAR